MKREIQRKPQAQRHRERSIAPTLHAPTRSHGGPALKMQPGFVVDTEKIKKIKVKELRWTRDRALQHGDHEDMATSYSSMIGKRRRNTLRRRLVHPTYKSCCELTNA